MWQRCQVPDAAHAVQPAQDAASFGLGRLFWSTSEAIVGADLSTGTIVLWNPAAHSLFGYAPDEAVGMPLERLVPASLREQHLAGVARYRNSGVAVLIGGPPTEILALTKDGEELDVALSLTDVTEEDTDGPRRILAVIRDMTAVRRAERKLQATLEAMDQFVAAASHDLRNPLTVISGFTEILLNSRGRLKPEEQQEFLELIARSSAHAARLVEDLLTSSRLEAGAMTAEPQAVDLAEAVPAAIGSSGVTATAQLDGAVSAWVDLHHLDRMLVNLLMNAARHGLPPITVTARNEGPQVAISVDDGGHGVPDTFAPKLFTRFACADPTSSEGTGLGLAIVQGLAAANGGNASYSRNGPRSSFTLHLPAQPNS